MQRNFLVLYLIVMTLFFSIESQAGTVYFLEPSTNSRSLPIYYQFFNELALILVQDELYRKSDDSKDPFFGLPPEQKVAEAGALCGDDQTLSVVWIETVGKDVTRLGLVVSTPKGKLARWVQFDSPIGSLSDLAIITGELLTHGRTFAESSTAKKDGWILVDSEIEKKTQSTITPSPLLDSEKPWDKPELTQNETLTRRFSVRAKYGLEAGLSGKGARVWMGGGVLAAMWLHEQLAISLLFDIAGAIPDPTALKVRGVRVAPAMSIAVFLEFNSFGFLFDLAFGPVVTAIRVERDDQPNASDRGIGGRGRIEVLMVIASNERISLNFGPNLSFSLPTRRLIESVSDSSDEINVVYSTSVVSLGGVFGMTLRL